MYWFVPYWFSLFAKNIIIFQGEPVSFFVWFGWTSVDSELGKEKSTWSKTSQQTSQILAGVSMYFSTALVVRCLFKNWIAPDVSTWKSSFVEADNDGIGFELDEAQEFFILDNKTCTNSSAPSGRKGISQDSASTAKYAFYYHVFVLVFGLVGNTLTLCLLRRTKTPKTIKIILICLSLSDNIYLLRYVPLMIYEAITHKNPLHIFVSICKLWPLSGFFFNHMSFWLVAILTLERCIAISKPFTFKTYVNMKSTLSVISLFALINSALAIFAAVNFNLISIHNSDGNFVKSTCTPVNHFPMILFLNVSVGHFVPECIVLIGNILIVVNFMKHRDLVSNVNNTSRGAPDSKLLLTTISVSVALITLSTPLDIYTVFGRYIFGPELLRNPNNIYHTVSFALGYTNFGINFYLYVAFAKAFRSELRTLVCGATTNGKRPSERSTASTVETELASGVQCISGGSTAVMAPEPETFAGTQEPTPAAPM